MTRGPKKGDVSLFVKKAACRFLVVCDYLKTNTQYLKLRLWWFIGYSFDPQIMFERKTNNRISRDEGVVAVTLIKDPDMSLPRKGKWC